MTENEPLICWRCKGGLRTDTYIRDKDPDNYYLQTTRFLMECITCGYTEDVVEEFRSEIIGNYRAAWCFKRIKELEEQLYQSKKTNSKLYQRLKYTIRQYAERKTS